MNREELKKITENLFSVSKDVVLKTIKQIRETGSSELLPAMFELLLTLEAGEIRKEIISVLYQLKETASVPIVMEAIQNPKYKAIQQTLLASCWNSGLDYAPFLPIFTAIFIEADFMVAFEVFTIVDNTESKFFKSEDLEKSSVLIENADFEAMDSDTKSLLVSFKRILAEKKQEFTSL